MNKRWDFGCLESPTPASVWAFAFTKTQKGRERFERETTHMPLQGLPWPKAQTGDLYHRNTFDHSLLDECSRRSYWRVYFCVKSLCTYVAGCVSPCLHDCLSVHLEVSNTITVSSKRVRTSTHEFGGGLWPNSWQNGGIYFDSGFRRGGCLIYIH